MDIVQTIVYYVLLLLIRLGDSVLLLLAFIANTLVFFTRLFFSILSFCKSTLFALLLGVKRIFTGKRKGAKTQRSSALVLPGKRPGIVIRARYFLFGALFSGLFFFLPVALFLFFQQLPSPKALATRQIPQTTKIYDRNGILLTQIYGPQDRTIVQLSDIPDSLKKATIAIEDKNFYTHPGFDPQAILRALNENVSGRSFQGASTITQQLVRSSFLTNETTILRKAKEIIIAFWTERLYSKDEILMMYFNQIPYGGTAWGVEAASEVYFGKHVSDLNLAESAFIAGITSAPTTYSPFGQQPDLWKTRQKEVLVQMTRLGFISKAEEQDALIQTLRFRDQPDAMHAPHFVNYVKDFLAQKYGLSMVERGGLTITTSIDLTLQKKAEEIVAQEVDNSRYLNLSNGAMLVINPQNGDVLAMVGSQNFNDPNGGNVNVTTRLRQPGSSIKPVTYAAALTKGFTAATILDDSPVTYTNPGGPSYSPVNYDGRFRGRIPLRLALGNSLNTTAVKTLNAVGIETMVNLGKQMGISSWGDPEEYGLSITLGAAEATMVDMATVFGTLANNGERVDVDPILKITDYKGTVLEEKTTPSGKRVLPEGVTFILSDILADNNARTMEFGSNSPLYIPNHYVSVKTGTSDNKRDNWTIGYTNDFVTAVWVGNNDNSPMSQSLASGITGAAPIWNKMMIYLLEKNPEERDSLPEDIVVKPCFGRQEYFLKGTENIACQGFGTSPTLPRRR